MDENVKKLLYTTKDGRWYWETDYAVDYLELDDEDIAFERIPEIRKLLVKPVSNWSELDVPLIAAQILTSWGDEEGLKYLEYVVDLRPDLWGNGQPHRLRGYDTTYEWIANAVIAFAAFRSSYEEFDNKVKLINPILLKLLGLCENQKFEFQFFNWILRRNYREYDEGLKSYLGAMLADDSGFHHHKPTDAVKFFEEYDPEYLDKALAVAGKTRADY